MNIIIPTFEEIKLMPPTITLINELAKMGHNITYITIYPDEYYANFDQKKINNVFLCKKKISLLSYVQKVRLLSSIAFRIDTFIKKIIAHSLQSTLKRILKEDDILWVVNELTVMYAGSSFLKKYKKNYLFTIYELHYNSLKNRYIKLAAKDALVTVVPEYNRSHIQRSFFDLEQLPLILPNKPSGHSMMKHMDIKDKEAEKKIKKIISAGKKIVLYMGIITEERPLNAFIEAIQKVKNNFELVIIGRESSYLNKLKNEYPNGFTYLGYLQPPKHLEIASWADVGLLVYVSENNKNGLNALYCAPNKIYEYTGFGMPVITNNIPGLYYTVQYNKCGYCVDLNNTDDIVGKLVDCLNNYESLSEKAIKFFDSVDVPMIITQILDCFQNRSELIKSQER